MKMLEPIENQYEAIGYIARSHGVRGEVVIISDIETPQLFETIDLVHLENARGDLVPARIESVRVQDKHNRLSFFVKFEHVTDRTRAEAIKNFTVYIEREKVGELTGQEDESADLSSFDVIFSGKRYAAVEAVIENPAHPILKVITADHRQLLIPFVEEYVVEVNEEEQTIECRNLDQLIDLKQ